MAQYVEKKLPVDDPGFDLDRDIRLKLRADVFKSAEVVTTGNTFVIRYWFALPYDLDQQEEILTG